MPMLLFTNLSVAVMAATSATAMAVALPEHAAWCIAKHRVLLALAAAVSVDLPL